jgi:hypothetical protein
MLPLRRAAFFSSIALSGFALTAGVLAACSSDDPVGTPTDPDGAADDEAGDGDGGKKDVVSPIPKPDSSCSNPNMGANGESKCVGQLGKPVPGSGGAGEKKPGEACNNPGDCQPFCCACPDGGTFTSSVGVCDCNNQCATASITCATFAATFQLCQ